MNTELMDVLMLSRGRARRMSSSILAIATAVALCLFAVESADTEVTHSTRDPGVDVLLKSTMTQLAAGDAEAAIADLMVAAERASTMREGSAEFCLFGQSVVILADLFQVAGHPRQAVVAHAIAGRFAQDCRHLDARGLELRKENAQAAALLVGHDTETSP